MKKYFRGYYRPTESEFGQLWKEAVFVPDANTLLNLYRYSAETAEGLLDILSQLAEVIWVPHQVLLEFHRNRLTVIAEQEKAYREAEQQL